IDSIPHWRIDDPRRDPVDADSVLDEAQTSGLGQTDDSGFAGAIDRNQGLAAASGLARHVDDLATVTLPHHLSRDRLQREQHAFNVDGEDAVVAFFSDL